MMFWRYDKVKMVGLMDTKEFPKVFPWKKAISWAFVFLLIKVAVFSVATYLVKSAGEAYHLCTWDCGYYKAIATAGYDLFKPNVHSNLAFYPGFPLIVRFFMEATGLGFESTAVVVNLASFFLMTVLAMRWIWELGLKELFYLPVLLWSADRYTFWSHVPYTESTFMLLGIAFLLLLRQRDLRQKKWVEFLLLPLSAGMLSAMRLVGMSAIASWGWGEFRKFLKSPVKGAWVLVLGLWGFLGFLAYLQSAQGDWSVGFQTTASWGRHFDLFGLPKNLFHLLKFFYFPTVLVVGLSSYILLNPPKELNLSANERWFFGFLLLLPLLNSIPLSTTRYFSILLPAYVYVGHKLSGVWSRWRWFHAGKIAVAVFVVSELMWQVRLTQKYFRAEAFNWLN